MMKYTNTISDDPDIVLSRANTAYLALQAHGAEIQFSQNAVTAFGAALKDYAGDPAGEGLTLFGKLGNSNNLRQECALARKAKNLAQRIASDLVMSGKDLLKRYLGRQWNPAWVGAGFTNGSLKSKADPLPALTQMRMYFLRNPGHENAALEITAVKIQEVLTTLVNSRQALDSAVWVSKLAMMERDDSLRQVRKRLTSVRTELKCLLGDADPRWYDFGFPRPIDSRIPLPVEGLVLAPGLAGQILATWQPSSRAKNYRVSYMPVGSNDPATEAGLIGETEKLLAGLPSGTVMAVFVSAVNATGETAATEAQLQVP